jgi:hypothetical protein
VPAAVTNVVSVAAGEDHALALRADGTVVAWNSAGVLQTDTPPSLTNVVMIAAGTGHNLAMTADGTVVAWPDTNVPSGLANATMLAAGYYHSMAVVKGIPPPLRVSLSAPARTPEGFSFSLPTLSGRVYRPEYKLSLSQTTWVPLPLCSGNGGALRLTVPAAANSQAFFRVRQW